MSLFCQSKHTSLLVVHTGADLGGGGQIGTMDRRGVRFFDE
jgi:hypothetical protein